MPNEFRKLFEKRLLLQENMDLKPHQETKIYNQHFLTDYFGEHIRNCHLYSMWFSTRSNEPLSEDTVGVHHQSFMDFHIQHYTNFLIWFVFSDKQIWMNNAGKLFSVEESLFPSHRASSCYEEFDSILYLQCSYREGAQENVLKNILNLSFLQCI